jgi:hypothetical protein
MRSTFRAQALVAGVVLGLHAAPGAVAGQETPGVLPALEQQAGRVDSVTAPSDRAGEGSLSFCAARPEDDPFLAQVSRARELETPEAAQAALDALEPEARRFAAEAPNDAAAQYRLAAVMGARLDDEHGRSKMSGAGEVRDQAERVLELEPEHPGASYMLGRIHASVLRLGGLKRFLAKSLFGGKTLEGASWERAQALLEVAVRGDPCVPEHHFELARVYAQRGNTAGAERELASVRELTEGRDGRTSARLRERADELSRKL